MRNIFHMKFIFPLFLIILFGGDKEKFWKGEIALSQIMNHIPNWKKGDWWIIETRFLGNISQILHGPERLGMRSFFHLYEVVGEQNIEEKATWIIDIKATKVPSEITNDHGNNYLWRLFLNKNDLSLVRFMMDIRGGTYLITGKNTTKQTFDYKNGNPIVIDNVPVLTPIDIPKLPSGGFPRFLTEDEKESIFYDEDSHLQFCQYIVAIEERINEKPGIVLYITLYNKDLGIRTQKWIPGLPWWQEWRYATSDRFTNGMWYAKLIDWSGSK